MKRVLGYIWAGPITLAALVIVGLVWLTRGKVRVVRGAIEASGGWLLPPILCNAFPWVGVVAGMTLGHVIIGVDEANLDAVRDHEHVHVRQCERWGPFIVPAYCVASLVAVCRGGHIYRDNCFEREAYGTA